MEACDSCICGYKGCMLIFGVFARCRNFFRYRLTISIYYAMIAVSFNPEDGR